VTTSATRREGIRPFGTASLAYAVLLGLAAGVGAQYLRQCVGPVGALGGSTALWVTLGCVLAWRSVHGRPLVDAWVWAVAIAASYLLAWIFSYHGVFAIRESTGFALAWHEARFWLAAVAPASGILGLVAAGASHPGRFGDICLALPLAWSLPEVVAALDRGLSYFLVVSLPALVVALVPLATERSRGLSRITIAGTALVGALAVYFVLSYTARF